MKRFNIQLPQTLLATVVGLGGLATFSAFGNINRAVANEYRGEKNQISQQMYSPQEGTRMGDAEERSILKELSQSESFNTFIIAIEAAGLTDTLENGGQYTVFAPTDEAFAALPPETLEALLQPENQETLRQILEYHVVLGASDSSEIRSGFFETAEGSGVNINVAGSMVQVEGANVTQPDIQAKNGVVHGIDQVILPPDISAAELQDLTAVR